MATSVAKIDWKNFASAFEVSEKTKTRIRYGEEQFSLFLINNNINLNACKSLLQEQKVILSPKITIISKGLMKGLYIYSIEEKIAYYFYEDHGMEVQPLKRYNDYPECDFIISYARKNILLARKFNLELQRKGFKTFFIDVENANDDPIWQIRFREALFYSRYYVPIFTIEYLDTEGSFSELFDFCYMRTQTYRSTFFSPILPIVKNYDSINFLFADAERKQNSNYKKGDWSWLKWGIFPIDLSRGVSIIMSFLNSIILNDKGVNNYEFISFIERYTDRIYFKFIEELDLKMCSISLRHPIRTNEYYIFDILSDGRVIDRQIGEPNEDAYFINFSEPLKNVIETYFKSGDYFQFFTIEKITEPIELLSSFYLPVINLVQSKDIPSDISLSPCRTYVLIRFIHKSIIYNVKNKKLVFSKDSPQLLVFGYSANSIFTNCENWILAEDIASWTKSRAGIKISDLLTDRDDLIEESEGLNFTNGVVQKTKNFAFFWNMDTVFIFNQKLQLFTKYIATSIFYLTVSENEKYVCISTSMDIQVWTINDIKLLWVCKERLSFSGKFSTSNTFLSIGLVDGTVNIYETQNFTKVYSHKFQGTIFSLDWLNAYKILIGFRDNIDYPNCGNKKFAIWDLVNKKLYFLDLSIDFDLAVKYYDNFLIYNYRKNNFLIGFNVLFLEEAEIEKVITLDINSISITASSVDKVITSDKLHKHNKLLDYIVYSSGMRYVDGIRAGEDGNYLQSAFNLTYDIFRDNESTISLLKPRYFRLSIAYWNLGFKTLAYKAGIKAYHNWGDSMPRKKAQLADIIDKAQLFSLNANRLNDSIFFSFLFCDRDIIEKDQQSSELLNNAKKLTIEEDFVSSNKILKKLILKINNKKKFYYIIKLLYENYEKLNKLDEASLWREFYETDFLSFIDFEYKYFQRMLFLKGTDDVIIT